jgi:hypothetical protein
MTVELSSKLEKAIKKLSLQSWVADVEGKTTEELKEIIVQSEGNIHTVKIEVEENEKINAAKELIKDLMEPYKEAIAVQKTKIQYALEVMQGRGVDLDQREEKE